MFIMRRDPALLGGALMIRPVPKFAGRSPDVYHEEGPSSAGRSPDDFPTPPGSPFPQKVPPGPHFIKKNFMGERL